MSECKHCNGHGGAFIGHAPKPRWYPCVVCNREEPVDPKDATITRLTSEVATLQSYKALHQSLTAELERARKYESEHDTLQNVIGNQHELLEKQKAELERVRKELDNLVIDIVTAASEDVANSSTVVRVVSNVRKDRDALAAELEEYRLRLAGVLIAAEGGNGCPNDAIDAIRTCPTIKSVMDLREQADRFKWEYHELLYAVANKYDGETRHQTALRYIREREQSTGGPASALAPAPQAQEGGECETDRP